MNKKYNSKKKKFRKNYKKKTKIKGGSSINIFGRENNANSQSIAANINNIFYTPSELLIKEHYLLLGLDLLYSGLKNYWDPQKRLSSIGGHTIRNYKIIETNELLRDAVGSVGSATSVGTTTSVGTGKGRVSAESGGSGKVRIRGKSGSFALDRCIKIKKEACGKGGASNCEFNEKKKICSLKGNFIICNQTQCKTSKWYLLNLDYGEGDDTKIITVLCICLCWGSNFSQNEFNELWKNGLRDNLLKIFQKGGYDQIMINGHSMGAGLTYLILIEIFNVNDKEIFDIIIKNIDTFKNLYLHLFGMGRLPTPCVIKFKELYNKYNFEVYDIISYDSVNNLFDSRLDSIKVANIECDYLSTPNPNFYCLNLSQKNPKDKSNFVGMTQVKKDLPEKERKKYSHCQTTKGWGEIYSDPWRNCQALLDKYHTHNTVSTYCIDDNGNLFEIKKNEMLFNKKITETDISSKDYPTGKLHAIKTYNNYFKKFVQKDIEI
jgi:hypothetical protein